MCMYKGYDYPEVSELCKYLAHRTKKGKDCMML